MKESRTHGDPMPAGSVQYADVAELEPAQETGSIALSFSVRECIAAGKRGQERLMHIAEGLASRAMFAGANLSSALLSLTPHELVLLGKQTVHALKTRDVCTPLQHEGIVSLCRSLIPALGPTVANRSPELQRTAASVLGAYLRCDDQTESTEALKAEALLALTAALHGPGGHRVARQLAMRNSEDYFEDLPRCVEILSRLTFSKDPYEDGVGLVALARSLGYILKDSTARRTCSPALFGMIEEAPSKLLNSNGMIISPYRLKMVATLLASTEQTQQEPAFLVLKSASFWRDQIEIACGVPSELDVSQTWLEELYPFEDGERSIGLLVGFIRSAPEVTMEFLAQKVASGTPFDIAKVVILMGVYEVAFEKMLYDNSTFASLDSTLSQKCLGLDDLDSNFKIVLSHLLTNDDLTGLVDSLKERHIVTALAHMYGLSGDRDATRIIDVVESFKDEDLTPFGTSVRSDLEVFTSCAIIRSIQHGEVIEAAVRVGLLACQATNSGEERMIRFFRLDMAMGMLLRSGYEESNEYLGINAAGTRFLGSWAQSNSPERLVSHIARNMRVFAELESVRQCVAQELRATFGIRVPGRYSPKTLIEQLQSFVEDIGAYRASSALMGLVVTATFDMNGAFDRCPKLQSFLGSTRVASYGIRSSLAHTFLTEVEDPAEFSERLRVADRYNRPYGLIWIRGHGTADGQGFYTSQDRIASISDITDRAGLLDRIHDKLIVLVDSCHCGQPGGLCEQLAEYLRPRVKRAVIIGQDRDSYLVSIKPSFEFAAGTVVYEAGKSIGVTRRLVLRTTNN